jgi:hypothetical protein
MSGVTNMLFIIFWIKLLLSLPKIPTVTLILPSDHDIEAFLFQISVTSIIRLLLLCPSTNPCGSLQHWSESLRL